MTMSKPAITPVDYIHLDCEITKMLSEGKTLPVSAENDKQEAVIISKGSTEDGIGYYRLYTFQDNGWIRVNYYYADGTIDEIYER